MSGRTRRRIKSRPQPIAPTGLWLSIVIPAFNEAARLPRSLRAIHAFLKRRSWLDCTEVIVVDDGSADETIAAARRCLKLWSGAEAAPGAPGLKIIAIPHAGKGAAIRHGALLAQGECIFLCDADLSMPITELPRFLPPAGQAGDLAIASREAPGARRIGEPAYRHIMGRIFNWVVWHLALPGIDDTQCGFKRLTRAAAHDLFPDMRLDGLSFDVELLALARLRGYSIVEVPIDWFFERNSRVRPLRDTILMVRDVWHVRCRMRRLRAAMDAAKDSAAVQFETPTAL